MPMISLLLFLFLLFPTSQSTEFQIYTGQEPSRSAGHRLSKPLIGEDGRIYACSEKNLFAFESNGTIAWTIHLGYICNAGMAPVQGGQGKISNTEGELYCLSVRSPYFKWIQDFSSLDKYFTVTPGNNGRLYVTVPVRALVLALDALSGTILWQRSIGPLSTTECAPVVDSNGWISVGSLDGFLYSFSPTGMLKKFSKADALNSVVQVAPLLDCSGYAVYFSQTEMEGKISHTVGDYTYVSAMRPKTVIFALLVPATGSIYWSESYPDQFLTSLSKSDLRQFVLDEGILLAFVTASSQKRASSCSQARPKYLSIYTGNERAIVLFLLFESAVLAILAGLVRFCCIFWRKKKLQGQNLGSFLEKRRSLQLKKKVFDRTITALEQKAAEEAVANEVLEKLGDMVREREGIERKLSTTYSLGRDRAGSQSRSLLPLYDGKTRSYSFQSAKKESVTIFHTLSDTSSGESSSEKETNGGFHEEESAGKAKTPIEAESSSNDGICETDYQSSPSETTSSSRRC
uniref:Protein GAMETE EXPRESSED 3 n=1 Tax=Fagus sylvatica TaxID=28930 RepID=A0A2N9E3Q5_FAGSY